MKVEFGLEARRELRRAMNRYDELRTGLGQEFIDAVSNILLQISEWPSAGRPIDEHLRGRIVRRFPYWLIYEQRNSVIRVTAVAHQSRGDDYWRSRGGLREPSAEYWPLVA